MLALQVSDLIFNFRRDNDGKGQRKESPPPYRSMDSDEQLLESSESFTGTGPKDSSRGFSTPVKTTSNRHAPTNGNDMDVVTALEKERAKLDKKQRKLEMDSEELERQRGDFEARREELETREKRLVDEKHAIAMEREAMAAEAEALRKGAGDSAETKGLLDKLARMKEECDDFRRQTIQLKQEIERGQKSLEAEKTVSDLTWGFDTNAFALDSDLCRYSCAMRCLANSMRKKEICFPALRRRSAAGTIIVNVFSSAHTSCAAVTWVCYWQQKGRVRRRNQRAQDGERAAEEETLCEPDRHPLLRVVCGCLYRSCQCSFWERYGRTDERK